MIVDLKTQNFKKFVNPYKLNNELEKNNDFFVKYVFQTKIKELQKFSELSEWMETNPREQKLTSKVSRKIKESLNHDSDYNFHNLNRGIVFNSTEIRYNTNNKIVQFELSDSELHGNIDGGHTLKIILENINEENNLFAKDKYVTIELFGDLEKDQLIDLAESRNTSAEVKSLSLEELRDSFKELKEILDSEKFKNNIKWSENGKQTIDGREIISFYNMFNFEIHKKGIPPITTYSAKETELKKFVDRFKKDGNKTEEILNRKETILDIFRIYEKIELKIDDKVKANGKRYKTLPFATNKKNKNKTINETFFQGEKIDYFVPKGIIYPLIFSFTALLDEKSYQWKAVPFDVWDEIGEELVNYLIEELRRNGNNPNSIGKHTSVWKYLYQNVENYLLKNSGSD